MEKAVTEKATLLNAKSMYLKINNDKVDKLEKMISLLNKRKGLIGEGAVTDYDKNEREILLLRTDYELAKHHKNLADFKRENEKFIESSSEVLNEMDTKWNEVIAKAKKEAVHKKDIKQILASMDDVNFDDNIDVKINYYLQLKSMVYNQAPPKLEKVK